MMTRRVRLCFGGAPDGTYRTTALHEIMASYCRSFRTVAVHHGGVCSVVMHFFLFSLVDSTRIMRSSTIRSQHTDRGRPLCRCQPCWLIVRTRKTMSGGPACCVGSSGLNTLSTATWMPSIVGRATHTQ